VFSLTDVSSRDSTYPEPEEPTAGEWAEPDRNENEATVVSMDAYRPTTPETTPTPEPVSPVPVRRSAPAGTRTEPPGGTNPFRALL